MQCGANGPGQLQQRVAEARAEQAAVGLGEERLLDLPGAHGLAW